MGLKQDLQNQIAVLQSKLNAINNVQGDTFPLGTVALFASNSGNTKWLYIKSAEETWYKAGSAGTGTKQLIEWIYDALQGNVGYFEVYILSAPNSPFYASA